MTEYQCTECGATGWHTSWQLEHTKVTGHSMYLNLKNWFRFGDNPKRNPRDMKEFRRMMGW